MSTPNNYQSDINKIGRIAAVKNILEVICRTTGMGFSAVARVTDDRWIACEVNDQINFGLLPGGELKLETTICNEIRQHHQPVIINHVALDRNFSNHHTPAMYGFQSYISIPIFLKTGAFFGTLCAIDPNPAVLDTLEIREMFTLFADLIAFHLNAIDQLEETEAKLAIEKENTAQRENFIAILGHDLRNPLGASLNAAQVLMRLPIDDKAKRLSKIVQDSSLRMAGLIDNILDFARGKFGNGFILQKQYHSDLESLFNQVILELAQVFPDTPIITDFELSNAIFTDGKRLSQLLSNLLANALMHGEKSETILVSAKGEGENFYLSVKNKGDKISDEMIAQLFKPFTRGDAKQGKKGLGLGLYITQEIAQAHGGVVKVHSNEQETCFTFKFPK